MMRWYRRGEPCQLCGTPSAYSRQGVNSPRQCSMATSKNYSTSNPLIHANGTSGMICKKNPVRCVDIATLPNVLVQYYSSWEWVDLLNHSSRCLSGLYELIPCCIPITYLGDILRRYLMGVLGYVLLPHGSKRWRINLNDMKPNCFLCHTYSTEKQLSVLT